MLVQVHPKRRPKIHDVTSQKTVRNLVCCYVYINLINVRLVLTRRKNGPALDYGRHAKTKIHKSYGKRDDHEKILLKHVKGNKCNADPSKIILDLGEFQLRAWALELKLGSRF
jgi:hypothetical protein